MKGKSLEIFKEHGRRCFWSHYDLLSTEPDVLILEVCDVPNLRQQKLAVGFFLVFEKNVFPFPVEQTVWRPRLLSSCPDPPSTSMTLWVLSTISRAGYHLPPLTADDAPMLMADLRVFTSSLHVACAEYWDDSPCKVL